MGYVGMIFKGCADSSELDEPMGCQTNVIILIFFGIFKNNIFIAQEIFKNQQHIFQEQNGYVCELCFCDSDDCNN